MSASDFTVEIAMDGTLIVPAEVTRALGLMPRQMVTIQTREGELVLRPSDRARLDRLDDLLRFALAGVTWSDIEAARDDRCVSA